MQINLLNKYGIKSHAVKDRDYRFINGDNYDFRYENIEILNKYIGVSKITKKGIEKYKSIILINGNFVIGIYDTEIEAAIAYNKACDILRSKFPNRQFRQNIIENLSPKDYASIYSEIKISDSITGYNVNR